MTAIDRTAFPRLKRLFTAHELSAIYTPTAEDMQFAARATRTNSMRCNLLVLLKCFQRLGYFPALDTIPETLVDHVRSCLGLTPQQAYFGYETPRTLYRHHELIRAHLAVTAYGPAARRQAALAIEEAAQRMDRPADLINAALDTPVQQRYELPAFSTLDKLTRRIRAGVNRRYFAHVDARLTQQERERFAALLVTTPRQLSSRTAPTHTPHDAPHDASQGASAGATLSPTSGHARLKARPERVTPRHLKMWQAHLVWLQSLGDTARLLEGIPPTKIAQWAAEARALDAPTTAAFAPLKRQAVLLCLVYEEQIAACDALVTMLLTGVAALHTRGKEALDALRATQRQTMESLISTLAASSRSMVAYTPISALIPNQQKTTPATSRTKPTPMTSHPISKRRVQEARDCAQARPALRTSAATPTRRFPSPFTWWLLIGIAAVSLVATCCRRGFSVVRT